MAKTKILSSEELAPETWFRLKITKWERYQRPLAGEEKDAVGRTFVKLRTVMPTDTMLEERGLVRGLFWELLRFSGGGRRPGWVVAGANEPLTVKRLAYYLRLPVEDVFEPLKRLMDTSRVQLWEAAQFMPDQANLSQSDENNEGSQTHRSEVETHSPVSQTERHSAHQEKEEREIKIRGRERKDVLSASADNLVQLWNSTATKLPKVSRLTKQRKAKIEARLAEHPDLKWWEDVFKKANSSAFLCGDSHDGWKASFDWMLKNTDNAIKVMEGQYERDQAHKRGTKDLRNVYREEGNRFRDVQDDEEV